MLGLALEGVFAAAALGVCGLAVLRQVRPEARQFRLKDFELHSVAFTAIEPEVLELTEELAPEPLDLVDPLPEPDRDSRVVQLFAARQLPTPGELAERIEHHLSGSGGGEERSGNVLELEIDAAAALRQALGDLRRSLA